MTVSSTSPGSNSVTATSSAYSYLTASSPVVTSVASAASTLTITGTSLGSSTSTVMLASTSCPVTAASDTEITCTLPSLSGGSYSVVVNNPALGNSNMDIKHSVELLISSVSPNTGSFGGGTTLTVTGAGFSPLAEVKVCSLPATILTASTTSLTVLSPMNPSTDSTLVCPVTVEQESGTITKEDAFTYDVALTPSITSTSPARGGTGGGTLITITGSGFIATGNKVTIDGSICDIATESITEITCYTNYHAGAIESFVIVEIPVQGYARAADEMANAFYYIDRWSSKWTWGGTGTPLVDEMIVITEGQTILLDTDTPVLFFLLINGGTLIFDKEAPSIELQSRYILVAGGGKLIIGTEEEPYENKATITMHGNVRCTEMPVFGCKVIGIREGSLDIHGKYVPVTWTHLATTASIGATTIELKQPVTWKVGDHIALATTGDRNSQKENEENYIDAISDDGRTVTLKTPLKYQHISIEQTFAGKVVETRGEVALLTRNVLIKGTMNEQFVEVLPACEEEFSSGGAFSDAMQVK